MRLGEHALALHKVAHFPLLFPWVAVNLGAAYTLSGRVAEALPLLEQAVEQATSMRILSTHTVAVTHLSEAYLHADRLEEARQLAGQALELSRERKERGNEAWILRLLGALAAHGDSPNAEQATAHYRQALALAQELGMRPLQAHCHRGLGTLYAATGQREPAQAELSAAIAMYHDMEMTFWLPQTEAALAQVEGR
jgi:tetratricopeptide (TPR) repeat protein